MAEVSNTSIVMSTAGTVSPSCNIVNSPIIHPLTDNSTNTRQQQQQHPPLPLLPLSHFSINPFDSNSLTTPTNISSRSERVVDLTEDNESIIDLTCTSPTERYSHNQPRSSCRFANTPYSPEVIFLETINKSSKDKRKSPKKLKEFRLSPYTVTHESPSQPSLIKCPICLDSSSQFTKNGSQLVSTICGHLFCSQCLRHAISTMHKCPTCRKKLTLKQYHQIFL